MRIPLYFFHTFLILLFIIPAHAHDKHEATFPKLIPVPNGFQPEGVVRGRGSMAYVGSIKTGGIFEINLINGEGSLLVESADNPAVGMAYDERSNYLFVAGGPNGTVTVYDATDGQIKTIYSVSQPGDSFVNDGIVTSKAAYFTDSFAPVIYRIPLAKNGRLPVADAVETINLSGDFKFIPGGFNGNGIEASKKGNVLYLVNSSTGHLYQVNPMTGVTSQVTIANGDLVNGDGLLFHKHKLYVAQNFLNQITELKLSYNGTEAKITRIISDPEFKIPTTIAVFANALYAINSRFDVAPPPFSGNPPADPNLEYNLVRVGFDK